MRKIILILVTALGLNSVAEAAKITTKLKMVDGHFTATINNNDDEEVWMGDLDFKYLGSMPMHCESVGMGSSGPKGKMRSSATYECPNGIEIHLTRREGEKYADLELRSNGKKQLEMKVDAQPPLRQMGRSEFLSKRFAEKLKERNEFIEKNTIPLMQACINTIESARAVAHAVTSEAATGEKNGYYLKIATDALFPIYGSNAEKYVDLMRAHFLSNKDDAYALSMNRGSSTYEAQLCYQQPDKYIKDVGKMLWSGKIRR